MCKALVGMKPAFVGRKTWDTRAECGGPVHTAIVHIDHFGKEAVEVELQLHRVEAELVGHDREALPRRQRLASLCRGGVVNGRIRAPHARECTQVLLVVDLHRPPGGEPDAAAPRGKKPASIPLHPLPRAHATKHLDIAVTW